MAEKLKCPDCGNQGSIEVVKVEFLLEGRHQCGTLAVEQVSRGRVATCRCRDCGAWFKVERPA